MATILVVLVYLAFFALPSLSLTLDVPIQSLDGKTFHLKWMAAAEDPDIVYITIYSKTLRASIVGPLLLRVSDRHHTAKINSSPIMNSLSDCRLYAFINITYDIQTAISKSNNFTCFPVNSLANHARSLVNLASLFTTVQPGPTKNPGGERRQLATPVPPLLLANPTAPPGQAQSPKVWAAFITPTSEAHTSTHTTLSMGFSGPWGSWGRGPWGPWGPGSYTMSTGVLSPSTSPNVTTIPIPIPSTVDKDSIPIHRIPSRGAIIGGSLAGLAFLATPIVLILYYRNRRKRRAAPSTIPPEDGNVNIASSVDSDHPAVQIRETLGTMHKPRILSLFTQQQTGIQTNETQGSMHKPRVPPLFLEPTHRFSANVGDNRRYLQDHGIWTSAPYPSHHTLIDNRTEQVEHAPHDAEQTRMQHERPHSNLDTRGGDNATASEVGSETTAEVDQLRQQIVALSRRIEGLEAEREEIDPPPPDYLSASTQ